MGMRPLTRDILLPSLCDRAAAKFVQQLTRCQAENPQERMLFHVFRSAAASSIDLRTWWPPNSPRVAVHMNCIGLSAIDLCFVHPVLPHKSGARLGSAQAACSSQGSLKGPLEKHRGTMCRSSTAAAMHGPYIG